MKDKTETSTSKRSYQSFGHSQHTSHSSLSQAGSKSGLYGNTSKRNVAFESKVEKAPPKKNAVQVCRHFLIFLRFS